MPSPRALTTMLTVLAASAAFPAVAGAEKPPEQSRASASSGGAEYGTEAPVDRPTVPGSVARIVDGIAYAPQDAPEAVKRVIWAGNRIVGMPYLWGGGHRSFVDRGYDCSGTISFALHGADLLRRPRDSRSFARYGARGPGRWITVYTNPGHAYLTVAGIRLDTSAADDPGGRKGPRWRPLRESDRGYTRRHPVRL